jgi:hypothetical protein
MYYIFPIFLVTLSIIYENYARNLTLSLRKINLSKTPQVIFILIILLSLSNFGLAVAKKSQQFNAPILKYMQNYNNNTFVNINEITLYISNIDENAKVSNNCPYALYSVNQNGYISNSRYPWNLLSTKQKSMKTSADSNRSPDYYLICSSKIDNSNENLSRNPNYVLSKEYFIGKDESLTIYSKRIS